LPNQAKQRFLELSVNEISVVDTPANEVEFLVMKRMEDDSMETTTETVTETQKDANAEVVTVDAGASEDAAVNKALEQVAGMVESIAKAVGVNGTETTETTTSKSEGKEGGEEDTTKAKAKFDPRVMFGKQLKASGVTGDAFTKAMDEFDKAFVPFKPGASTQPPEKGTRRRRTRSRPRMRSLSRRPPRRSAPWRWLSRRPSASPRPERSSSRARWKR